MPVSSANKTGLQLEHQVQLLRDCAEAVHQAMLDQFGTTDTRTSRAAEICDACQRLRWDLERRDDAAEAAST